MGRQQVKGNQIEDSTIELVDISQAAKDAFQDQAFDPSGTELTETTIKEAIKETITIAGASASPGFSFGRAGNSGAGTWLQITGGVPSNKAGIPVALSNPELILVSVGNENVGTFSVSIYEHEGDEVNLTLLTTVTLTNVRTQSFPVSVNVTTGRQIAARINTGSAKNIGVSLQLKGRS